MMGIVLLHIVRDVSLFVCPINLVARQKIELCRSQRLNARWRALDEIYKFYVILVPSTLKSFLSVKRFSSQGFARFLGALLFLSRARAFFFIFAALSSSTRMKRFIKMSKKVISN